MFHLIMMYICNLFFNKFKHNASYDQNSNQMLKTKWILTNEEIVQVRETKYKVEWVFVKQNTRVDDKADKKN